MTKDESMTKSELRTRLRGRFSHGSSGTRFWSLICLAAWLAACVACPAAEATLKNAFKNDFRIGAALNRSQFYEENSNVVALIKAQFNTITPENVLKWGLVHPSAAGFDFTAGDRYVEFGEQSQMWIVGHTLIWHNQTPNWVFQDEKGNRVDRDTLLKRMREHILTVVGRYKGRIGGWDVVNEAVDEGGKLRKTPWLEIIGEEYLLHAYQFAHEADPKAQLYYNDYALENEAKRKGAMALIKKLQAGGIPIAAVGLQGHYKMDWPKPAEVEATISDFASLGIKVNITELDVDVLPAANKYRGADINERAEHRVELDPYATGLPDEVQQKLAKRYSELFSVFVKHRDVITRVTFWGVTDGDSWLNDWPVRGRMSYPLLFDRQGQPKPAFQAVIAAGR